ncbi:hypothetical protein V6N13_137530 [Hibiscus sabdariffa]
MIRELRQRRRQSVESLDTLKTRLYGNWKKCLIGTMASNCNIEDVKRRLHNWGLGDLMVKCTGGRRFLIDVNEDKLLSLLEKQQWSLLTETFYEICCWSEAFKIPSRTTWVEVTALNDASLEIPSNDRASIQEELSARSVEKSDLMGCKTKANLEDSGFGGLLTRGLGDGSTKSQCKKHGPKWVDAVKGGAIRLPYSDPKEGSLCLNQVVADLNLVGLQGIGLSNNDDVELFVNRAVVEDPNNLSPGGVVMAQEVLMENLVVSIGSKEAEREEISGRISPVLEHQEMDHVTLELPEFQTKTKPGRVKRVWICRLAMYWHGVLLRIMDLSKLRKNGLLLTKDIDNR